MNYSLRLRVIFTLLAIIFSAGFTVGQTTYNVVVGTDNVAIDSVFLFYNGSNIKQTSGATSVTNVTTTVRLDSVFLTGNINLKFQNLNGAVLRNDNFNPGGSTTTNVGVHNNGVDTTTSNLNDFETAMNSVISSSNLMAYLYYDNSSNLPTGPDFDLLWGKGLTNDDYLFVTERDGNTFFTVTPLGKNGTPITTGRELRFGFTQSTVANASPNGNRLYDWNTGYGSANRAPGQEQFLIAVDVDLFNLTEPIYGIRVDNLGDADIKVLGASPNSFDDNPNNPMVPGIIGNVFNDLDGLNDNRVDGTAINNPGGVQLYANLVQGGSVLQTEPVRSDGTYEFIFISAGSYSVVIDTSASGSLTSGLPSNWVHTGENDGAGVGNDGNTNGISPTIVVTDSLETQINFAINDRPISDTSLVASQQNPGGTTNVTLAATNFSGSDVGGDIDSIRITSFPTNTTSITINGNTYTSGTFPVGGVVIPTNAAGNPTQTITLDPVDGSDTSVISYVTIDEASLEDLTIATVSLPFTLSISGNVFNDIDGLNDNMVDGSAINNPAGVQLYANLMDNNNVVLATTPISATGTYSFSELTASTTYNVLIDTLANTIGATLAAADADLPTNWVHTGDTIGTGTGSDGTPDGLLNVPVATVNVPNVNFAINDRPISDTSLVASQQNPGGTTNVTVAATNFSGSDVGGDIDSIRITSFPTNTTSITINGNTYTSGTFPVGGVVIPTNAAGNPTQTITLDPVDGSDTSVISYVTIDEASLEDLTPATVSLPFTLSISGNVFNDIDGLNDNMVDGSAINNPAGVQLYANLMDNSNVVLATTPISATGTYSFSELTASTTYNVLIDTLANTIGATLAAADADLPTNWVHTGDTIGTGTGSDGTPDGLLNVPVATVNVPNVNFGIEQLPNSDNKTFTLSPSPAYDTILSLTTSNGMGPLTGDDPEDGSYGQGGDFILSDTAGMNGNRLFYDSNNNGEYNTGEDLLPGDTVLNYDSTKLRVKFEGTSSIDFTFTYAWLDAVSLADPTPATYLVSWSNPLPVTLTFFKVEKLRDADALLTWGTASEQDNHKFEIHKSIDGGLTYTWIGEVMGAGTSNELLEYAYVDQNAAKDETACYKLKQVDFDGSYEWSSEACLNWAKESTLAIYPNPADAFVTVKLPKTSEVLTIQLVDVTGKIISTQQATHGNRLIHVNTADLSRGVYFVRISGRSFDKTSQIIVNH